MSRPIPVGTAVEIHDVSSDSFQNAVVVDQPGDSRPPNEHETFIWVRYDNGCVVPVREWFVRVLPTSEEHSHTKEYIYAYPDGVEPNPIIGWHCRCGVTEYYDDDQIAGPLP